MKKNKVSIIVRTKNEERWISQCLSAIEKQSYKNHEVILVDNNSSDNTVKIAKEFNVKLVNYCPKGKFKPGKSINLGIEASDGEYISIISGHCIPKNKDWLKNLIRNLKKDDIAGVYGRQEPLSFTSSLDKRDLTITFGLDRKVQKKDPFFHNANSALKRKIWKKYPFDNDCSNIEDRIWGEKMISEGYKIIYDPEASVFHHHGIHHGLNEERAKNIVKILDSISVNKKKIKNIKKPNIAALIPIKGDLLEVNENFLIKKTIDLIKKINHIDEIIVSTDSAYTAEVSKNLGATKIIRRPERLSKEYIGISEVIKFSIEEYEKNNKKLDLVLLLEETYPFRDVEEINQMLSVMLSDGNDSLIAVNNERKGAWLESTSDDLSSILDQSFMPRNLKNKFLKIAQTGYCSILKTEFIRFGDILGQDVALYDISKSFNCTEVRTLEDMNDYFKLLED